MSNALLPTVQVHQRPILRVDRYVCVFKIYVNDIEEFIEYLNTLETPPYCELPDVYLEHTTKSPNYKLFAVMSESYTRYDVIYIKTLYQQYLKYIENQKYTQSFIVGEITREYLCNWLNIPKETVLKITDETMSNICESLFSQRYNAIPYILNKLKELEII